MPWTKGRRRSERMRRSFSSGASRWKKASCSPRKPCSAWVCRPCSSATASWPPRRARFVPHATFTGWQTPAQIRAWLQRARALLFPPLWYETLGLVVVEAAAAGVPAIISDRCAATDFLGDGERGLHFRHGSIEALCGAIERMRDPALASRLGRNAYDWHWGDPWTVENHVAELVALYERVRSEGRTMRQ